MSIRVRPPQCLTCNRFRSPLDGYPEQTCTAFPAGIPQQIWNNAADHRKPFAGDRDLHWIAADANTAFPDWAIHLESSGAG